MVYSEVILHSDGLTRSKVLWLSRFASHKAKSRIELWKTRLESIIHKNNEKLDFQVHKVISYPI